MSEITIYGKLVGNRKPLTDTALVEGIEDFPSRDSAEEGSVLGLDLNKKLVWTKVSSEGGANSKNFFLNFEDLSSMRISKELFQKMLNADTIKVLYFDSVYIITAIDYNKYINNYIFYGGGMAEGVENSIIINTSFNEDLDSVYFNLIRTNISVHSIVDDTLADYSLTRIYFEWNQENTVLLYNYDFLYYIIILYFLGADERIITHILYPIKTDTYPDRDLDLHIYYLEWLGEFDSNNQIKAWTRYTHLDNERELHIQIVPKTQGSSGSQLSGIPIIKYTANNSTCIVSPDTKTYITCEGNANIELEQIKDDEYAHSFLIVLLTIDSLYTVTFPAGINWLKPLVIEEYTKYFIIIEDNVAMYTSVKILED